MPCLKHARPTISPVDQTEIPGKSVDSCYNCLIVDLTDRVTELESLAKRQDNTIRGLIDLIYCETGAPEGPTSLQGRLVAIEEMLKEQDEKSAVEETSQAVQHSSTARR
jgi:hypothetical protein